MARFLKVTLTIVMIILCSMLLKSNTQITQILGIMGIYGFIYYFITLNSEEIKVFKLKEIITILISYNLQKSSYLLHKQVVNNKIFMMVNVIIVITLVSFFLYKLYREKEINKYEILGLFYEFLIISLPFYIIKGRGRQIIILSCLIYLIKSVIKKEYVLNLEIKRAYFWILSLILFSTTSFWKNNIIEHQIDRYFYFIENLLFLMIFMQIKVSNIQIKKMVSVGISASLIPIVPIIVEILQNKNFSLRLGEENPNVWGLEAAFWTIIFLYLVFKKYKSEYLILYLLYILGNIASGSRGAILSMLIVNFILFLYLYKEKTKILIITLFLGCFATTGILKTENRISYTVNLIKKEKKIDNSSAIRILIYKEAFRQFKEKPINGLGFYGYHKNSVEKNLVSTEKRSYIEEGAYNAVHAHNNILQLLSSIGILGFISYMGMNLYFLKVLCKKEIGTFIIFLIITYELSGIVDCTLNYAAIQRMLFLIMGLSFNYIVRGKDA